MLLSCSSCVHLHLDDLFISWSNVPLPMCFLILPFGIHGVCSSNEQWRDLLMAMELGMGSCSSLPQSGSLTLSSATAGLLAPEMSHVCEMQPYRCECFPACSTLHPPCLLFQNKHVAASETFLNPIYHSSNSLYCIQMREIINKFSGGVSACATFIPPHRIHGHFDEELRENKWE